MFMPGSLSDRPQGANYLPPRKLAPFAVNKSFERYAKMPLMLHVAHSRRYNIDKLKTM